LRHLFEIAAALAKDECKQESLDAELVRWLAEQVVQRGLTMVAGELEYDPANLIKVMSGKRGLPIRLRESLAQAVCSVK
jgi:hypothetical protein